ncbi:unnamed protein product [Rotaria socialis]|uniref:Uncharacterized protein n=1 Tax=Rotaria socialis TaxID=392032 RepID=A0A821ITH1_9BILA|nr:unnamed protein product [Rotaria socialis]
MGNLFLELSSFNQVEVIYNELLTSISNDNDKAEVYYQIGLVKYGQCDYKEAASFYEKSLEIKQKTVSEDDPSLTINHQHFLAYKETFNKIKANI